MIASSHMAKKSFEISITPVLYIKTVHTAFSALFSHFFSFQGMSDLEFITAIPPSLCKVALINPLQRYRVIPLPPALL